ncbi:MAG: 2-oxo acid dehydrogenase subunit E2, partial [Actinomycetota bacterium]
MTTTPPSASDTFGTNSWLVDEMYEQYRIDPTSVADTWREFFSDYRPGHAGSVPGIAATAPTPVTNGTSSVAASNGATTGAPKAAAVPAGVAGEPIRGAGAAIVANMERSLTVPTATSFRNVPARLLEVNRKAINAYMTRGGMGKVSFTHLIGYAIVRAIADSVPAMNNSFTVDDAGNPQIVRNGELNMGLAVDVAKADGSRTLVVPVLRNAGALSFAEFLNAYEELIRKVKTNKLAVTDFQGATITLTNPGTIGTVQSV